MGLVCAGRGNLRAVDSSGQNRYVSLVERRSVDVCVVGAGPAGLVVAHRLQQASVSCVVLERSRADQLCPRAKAGMLEHRAVRALADVGLAAPILERGTTNGVVELCVGGERRVFDYAALTGGHGHHVFPQHLLVRAWADALLAAGGQISFSTEVLAVHRTASGGSGAIVVARSGDGEPVSISCDAVVLAGGAGFDLIPDGIESYEHIHPFRWLTAMLEAPPLGGRTIYCAHPRGFAAHLRRSAEQTRYYLQIPAADGLGSWGDERIRAELELRLGVEGQGLIEGPIVERDVLDLRVRVREPLQQGSVYLAGDAAHLITPAGGKGMNLAIQDGLELAEGLIERHAGDASRLARYSERRLPLIWRAQEFSNWMLTVFCGGVLGFQRGTPEPGATFAQRLHRAQVERLFAEPAFARWFAHRYAGVDEAEG